MIENPFHAFIALVRFDQETIFLEKAIDKAQQEIEQISKNISLLEVDTLNAKNALKEAQKNVDAGELKMKELEQRISEEKIRLDNASNSKEYVSLQKEIEHLQKAQNEHEDILISAWNKLETSKQLHGAKLQEYEKNIAELHESMKEKEKNILNLQSQLKGHQGQRDQKEKLVDSTILEKYSMMRSQINNPVVLVEQGSCSACFYKVTNQDLIELRKNKLLQCRGCYRFLYLNAPKNE